MSQFQCGYEEGLELIEYQLRDTGTVMLLEIESEEVISRKIGMLFEANVLNGKVLMTSMDITSQPEKRIVARRLSKFNATALRQ